MPLEGDPGASSAMEKGDVFIEMGFGGIDTEDCGDGVRLRPWEFFAVWARGPADRKGSGVGEPVPVDL